MGKTTPRLKSKTKKATTKVIKDIEQIPEEKVKGATEIAEITEEGPTNIDGGVVPEIVGNPADSEAIIVENPKDDDKIKKAKKGSKGKGKEKPGKKANTKEKEKEKSKKNKVREKKKANAKKRAKIKAKSKKEKKK